MSEGCFLPSFPLLLLLCPWSSLWLGLLRWLLGFFGSVKMCTSLENVYFFCLWLVVVWVVGGFRLWLGVCVFTGLSGWVVGVFLGVPYFFFLVGGCRKVVSDGCFYVYELFVCVLIVILFRCFFL